jgi:hypothetical protein
VKGAPRLAQEHALGRVLHQGVLEQVARIRWDACRDSRLASNRGSSIGERTSERGTLRTVQGGHVQRGLVVRANLKGGMSRAHRADAWRRCVDDPLTLLRLTECPMSDEIGRERWARHEAVSVGVTGFVTARYRSLGLARFLAEEIYRDRRSYKYCGDRRPAANRFAGKPEIV